VGDEVFGLCYGGSYAEYVAVSYRTIMHKPKEISWETAAGIPEVWFTAVQAAFIVGGLKKGDTALFHAGASGVGQCLIQLAKAEGAEIVLATAGSDEKTKLCESLGATKGINYKSGDWAEEAKRAAPEGVDFIVDMVTGNSLLIKANDLQEVDISKKTLSSVDATQRFSLSCHGRQDCRESRYNSNSL
jgi:NADPH:quinone reductase-like Zn-dependent oxidoreductase